MAQKILIIEDERQIARLVRLYLEEAGFQAVENHDGKQAIFAFRHEKPDLVILDLNLPGIDGLDVCRALCRESDVPVIMLTARSEEADRLIGLEMGADDYIVKPFSPREVVARVRAVLRRTSRSQSPPEIMRVGSLTLDMTGYRASIGDHVLTLTPSEFEILVTLARNAGRVLSRFQLLEETQGVTYEGYERAIDQHIKNLRRKIEGDAGQARIIHTVHGVGYRLDPVEDNHVS
ncbi:MAG: response regulator transcription factor [Anaerolineae bacterium]|nr:response regulator transcription factor [Anaerolineae bacterium]